MLGTLAGIYETVGLLVFRRTVSFEAVRQVGGGILVGSRRHLEVWVSDARAEQGSARLAEWFQRRVERVKEQEAVAPFEPAHERHSARRPRG